MYYHLLFLTGALGSFNFYTLSPYADATTGTTAIGPDTKTTSYSNGTSAPTSVVSSVSDSTASSASTPTSASTGIKFQIESDDSNNGKYLNVIRSENLDFEADIFDTPASFEYDEHFNWYKTNVGPIEYVLGMYETDDNKHTLVLYNAVLLIANGLDSILHSTNWNPKNISVVDGYLASNGKTDDAFYSMPIPLISSLYASVDGGEEPGPGYHYVKIKQV